MPTPAQSRSPGDDTRQVPQADPCRSRVPPSAAHEAMGTALRPGIRSSDADPTTGTSAITPPLAARTDPHRGTGEMGTEGLDPSEPLGQMRRQT